MIPISTTNKSHKVTACMLKVLSRIRTNLVPRSSAHWPECGRASRRLWMSCRRHGKGGKYETDACAGFISGDDSSGSPDEWTVSRFRSKPDGECRTRKGALHNQF